MKTHIRYIKISYFNLFSHETIDYELKYAMLYLGDEKIHLKEVKGTYLFCSDNNVKISYETKVLDNHEAVIKKLLNIDNDVKLEEVKEFKSSLKRQIPDKDKVADTELKDDHLVEIKKSEVEEGIDMQICLIYQKKKSDDGLNFADLYPKIKKLSREELQKDYPSLLFRRHKCSPTTIQEVFVQEVLSINLFVFDGTLLNFIHREQTETLGKYYRNTIKSFFMFYDQFKRFLKKSRADIPILVKYYKENKDMFGNPLHMMITLTNPFNDDSYVLKSKEFDTDNIEFYLHLLLHWISIYITTAINKMTESKEVNYAMLQNFILVITSTTLVELFHELNTSLTKLQGVGVVQSIKDLLEPSTTTDILMFRIKYLTIQCKAYLLPTSPDLFSIANRIWEYEKGMTGYEWIDNAISTVHNIYTNLTTKSLVFNVMSLIDSNVEHCPLSNISVFNFRETNKHDDTYKHLSQLTQTKYILYWCHCSRVAAFHQLGVIFINLYHYDKLDNTQKAAKLVIDLLHENSHFKRTSYSIGNKLINNYSPLIKLPEDKFTPYDLGRLVDYVLYDKGYEFYCGDIRLFDNEHCLKLLDYKNWITDLREIYQVGMMFYDEKNSKLSVSEFNVLDNPLYKRVMGGNLCFNGIEFG
jgi:hypothetical protein